MKKYILFTWASLCFWSCSEDEIKPYQGDQYLYFSQLINTEKEEDKENGYMLVSFNNYPTSEEFTVKVGLSLVGKPFQEDAPYSVVIVAEEDKEDPTPNASSKNYRLPDRPTFGAGLANDTLEVTLVKTDDLKENVKLCLKLVPNDHFQGTMQQYEQIKIVFNNVISQPLWWDNTVKKVYLGTYSRRKYEEFVKCTNVADFGALNTAEKRKYSLTFKHYIAENNVMDIDAEGKEFPMVVPVN